MKTIAIMGVLLALAVTAVLGQVAASPKVQLKATIHKEQVEGDLRGAVEQFRKLSQSPNRAVAAQALVHLGECAEKLGEADARQAYEQVVAKFADQTEAVAHARARLAAMTRGTASIANVPTTHRLIGALDGYATIYTPPTPDGRYLRTAVGRDAALLDVASGEHRIVIPASPDPKEAPAGWFLSSDGRSIGYVWTTGNGNEVRVVSAEGGKPRAVFHSSNPLFALSVSDDGKYLLLGSGDGDKWNITLLSLGDGTTRVLDTFDAAGQPSTFNGSVSPDDRFVALNRPEGGRRFLYVVPANGWHANSEAKPLLADSVNDRWPVWTPDGRSILFVSDRSGYTGLWRIRVTDGRADGRPELVKADLGPVGWLSEGRNGTVFYSVETDRPTLYLATLDAATGRTIGTPVAVGAGFTPQFRDPIKEWAPDGRSIAYATAAPHLPGVFPEAPAITIRTLADGKERTLSLSLTFIAQIRWAPDGRSLLVQGVQRRNWTTTEAGVLCRVEVASGATTIVADPWPLDVVDWWPHDKGIYMLRRPGGPNTPATLVFRDLETSAETPAFTIAAPQAILGFRPSPDGSRFALVVADPAARTRLLQVVPLTGGERRTIATVQDPEALGPKSVTWTSDGRAVLCVRGGATSRRGGGAKRELWRFPVDGSQPTPTGLDMEEIAASTAQPNGNLVLFNAGTWKHDIMALDNLLSPPSGTKTR